ncbi:MAG TPA: hypothetical protein VGL58_12350 [Caulobacteraceae bacterium]
MRRRGELRITLSLDEDVAVRLAELRKLGRSRFKLVVNDALRRGLEHLQGDGDPTPRRFRTQTFDSGEPKFAVVSVSAALAQAEGDDFK